MSRTSAYQLLVWLPKSNQHSCTKYYLGRDYQANKLPRWGHVLSCKRWRGILLQILSKNTGMSRFRAAMCMRRIYDYHYNDHDSSDCH